MTSKLRKVVTKSPSLDIQFIRNLHEFKMATADGENHKIEMAIVFGSNLTRFHFFFFLIGFDKFDVQFTKITI